MSDSLEREYKADILIVDNRSENLDFLSNLLVKQGYRVRQARDGEMALAEIETILPDLIILAIALPNEICQRLKAIPIVFLIAAEETFDRAKAIDLGETDYIIQSCQPEEIVARIKTQLKIHLLQKQLKEKETQLQNQLRLNEIVYRFHPQPQINLLLLDRAIAATPNGIVISDAMAPDMPIVYVNPGFDRMTGYAAAEVIGKNCRFLQGEDRKQPAIAIMRQAIQQGQECRVTLRNYRKDGTLFWNDVSISPVRDEAGKVTHYIAVQTDISEYKRVEEERQRYQSSLQQMNLELYDLNQKLHRLANSDGLTGVANRRRFEEHLEQEWRRTIRENQPLSIILGDIDYFKPYNDTYGHLVGDDCLKAIAGAINRVVNRPADLVARYGGEEFAIILPNTPVEGTMQVAQLIRQEVQKLRIPHRSSLVADYVTMSLGIATKIPTAQMSPKALIEAADIALYQAKEQGRNCAVSHIG
jgi:two-component system, cell cycle response regulator